jgi:hypothetical protein
MKTTILLLLICVSPVSLSAQQADGLDRTAVSSIKTTRDKDGNAMVTTINRRFTLVDRPTQPLPGTLLLLEEFTNERELGADSCKGVVKAEAWFDPNLTKKAWSIEQSGDEGGVFDEFYVVIKHGCCMTRSTNVFFNLENGQRVFSATEKLSSVIVPNTGLSRYVAYHANDAVIAPLEPRDPDLKGVLQYASPTAPLWKLAIYSKTDMNESIKFRYQGKVVEDDSLMLWGVDGKNDQSSLSNFAIIVSLGQFGDIVIPIVNDAADLRKATVPPRIRVEFVK